VAGNTIEIWGRLIGEPELRITPAGTAVLRTRMEFAEQSGDDAMAIVMTGDSAKDIHASLKAGANIRVNGSLKSVRRRLKSGIFETGYEVIADSIKLEERQH
jgi:single-stranded DNA-binding protein